MDLAIRLHKLSIPIPLESPSKKILSPVSWSATKIADEISEAFKEIPFASVVISKRNCK